MKDQYQHYLELLKGLRLMDDDFFSEALDEKIEPVEYILRTILERNDIKVQCTEAQVEYKSATKRSIKLDIRAVDTEGRVLDIEVQRADKGASVRYIPSNCNSCNCEFSSNLFRSSGAALNIGCSLFSDMDLASVSVGYTIMVGAGSC